MSRLEKLPSILDAERMPLGPSNTFSTDGVIICHALVQEMGGELRIDSQEGSGTTYSVRLPFAGRG